MGSTYFNNSSYTSQEISHFSAHWKWLMAAGVSYILLGAMALMRPFITTLGLTYALAVLLLVLGGIQLAQAFYLRQRRIHRVRFFQSLLSLLAGVLLLRYPGEGMLTISLVLSFYFLISASAQFMVALSMRPQKFRTWGFIGAATSFILGAFILFTFPFSGLWLPAVLMAADLIIGGAALVGFAWALHSTRSSSYRNFPNGKISVPKNLRTNEMRPQ